MAMRPCSRRSFLAGVPAGLALGTVSWLPGCRQADTETERSRADAASGWPEPIAAIAHAVNAARLEGGLTPLLPENVLQNQVEQITAGFRAVESPRPTQADARRLKDSLPPLAHVSFDLLRSESRDGLVARAAAARTAKIADLTHLGVGLLQLEQRKKTWLALVVGSKLLPPMSPELVSQGRREFDLRCLACHREQLIRLAPPAAGVGCLLAACSSCRSAVDLYGREAGGAYHRPPWFLRGFKPAAVAGPAEAWQFVLQKCDLVAGRGSHDAWQTADRTYRGRKGNSCDLAILLGDWLAAAGFDARVVIGRAGDRPHAWAVVRAEGRDYILDPDPARASHRMPPRATVLTDYVPHSQFDRRNIWFRAGPEWTADYQDASLWIRAPWPLEPVPTDDSTPTAGA